MSASVIAILVLLGLFLVVLILFICQRNKNKELKDRLDRKTEAYNGLLEEFDLYRKSEQFKHQKEEETNEKIDDLHSGKLSADDILPKR
ncbi:hypothetical protein SAMN04487977_101447 [Treponema bryantii]|uniref:Uncharacterized protein n=1 Tax=Treponema bryantii TaxID=163 RepID=A0A1H9AU78_9SPIR|nr:hypothetical protein [Treponema bryantii]SEP79478.1 hypothetical protein SAMN04487977_101447 [Treponema bryantii]